MIIMQSTTSLTALGAIALLLLVGALTYFLMRSSGRKGRESWTSAPPTDALSHREALSAKHSVDRPTEDDLQRETLGPRGVPGEPSPAPMTPQRRKKTPEHLEPGHTA